MSTKELAIETIRQLPEDVTLERISDELAMLAAIRRGEDAANAGRVISQEEMVKRSASWISE